MANETDRASASLRIMGASLDMDAISNELQCSPTETRKAGDVQKYRRIQPIDIWILSSPLDRCESVESHVMWVVREMLPRRDSLRELIKSATVDVFCGYTSTGEGGISLSARTLALLSVLGINLEISIITLSEA